MSITPFEGRVPRIHPTAYVAPSVDLIGDVEVAEEASIWFGCVLRGDINRIVVGPRSNVQDNSVVHLERNTGVFLGESVTVGHQAMIHACTIEDECLIGMGSIVMDRAVIGARSIVGAGAVVTMDTVIPPGSLVLGTPAKVVRQLDLATQKSLRDWADRYVKVSRQYLAEGGEGVRS